jgi:hypothetical protein
MGHIVVDKLICNLQTVDAHFRHVAEDDALGRIYRGYENISDQSWASPL